MPRLDLPDLHSPRAHKFFKQLNGTVKIMRNVLFKHCLAELTGRKWLLPCVVWFDRMNGPALGAP